MKKPNAAEEAANIEAGTPIELPRGFVPVDQATVHALRADDVVQAVRIEG
ncbi:hypothetical protein [Arthrobacter sp. AZCC_0090]|nr:hypothetical protein [Arthrobacter sp. AZCC_0090]MBB6402738.1 hypothetical protein [Arthrobacter sp. AZCC_0090]